MIHLLFDRRLLQMQTHAMLITVSNELFLIFDAARQQEWDQLTTCGLGPLLESSKGSQL
jgi:hypothetical protein